MDEQQETFELDEEEIEHLKQRRAGKSDRVLPGLQPTDNKDSVPKQADMENAGQAKSGHMQKTETQKGVELEVARKMGNRTETITKSDITGAETGEPEALKCGECLKELDGEVEVCPHCGIGLSWDK